MGTFHIFHSGSIPFSEQRSIFVGRRNCHAWPFVATSQEAVLILQALRRSAESGHGFAAHYSKALGKLREKHDDIGQVLVCIGYTLALDEWTACATQTKKHTEGEGKCNDNCKTAIKFQGIGPDHFASSTTFRGCLLLSREWGAKTSRHIQDSWQISWFCGPYAWRNHLWLGQIHTNSWIQALNASDLVSRSSNLDGSN